MYTKTSCKTLSVLLELIALKNNKIAINLHQHWVSEDKAKPHNPLSTKRLPGIPPDVSHLLCSVTEVRPVVSIQTVTSPRIQRGLNPTFGHFINNDNDSSLTGSHVKVSHWWIPTTPTSGVHFLLLSVLQERFKPGCSSKRT